jgi:hypothetical protein
MRILILGLWVALTGCVTASKIAPIGKDTYKISATRYFCADCVTPINRAMEAAFNYCNKSGLMAYSKRQEQSGFGHTVTVTFVCDYQVVE